MAESRHEADRGRAGRGGPGDGPPRRRPCRACRAMGVVTRILEDERVLGMAAPHTDDRPSRAVHRVPVRQRRLALHDQRHRRGSGRLRGLQELRQDLERLDLPAGGLQHLRLHGRRHRRQARAGYVAGPPPQPSLQGQAPGPGVHAPALHHPHRALDLRLEVDVRPDLQRAQLDPVPRAASSRRGSAG